MDQSKCTWITLLPEVIFGAEGEENGQQGQQQQEDPPGNGEGQQQEDPPQQQQEEGKEDTSGLRSALQKERDERKKLEKELNRRKKAEEDAELKQKSEAEQERIKRENAEKRATALAEKLRDDRVNRAIEKAAKEFIDLDDVLRTIDRSSLGVEQDEDDPTNIEIDEKSIERAVKALATKKPHWLKTGTDDGNPTGSKFGGSRRQEQKKSEEETLRELYPSL